MFNFALKVVCFAGPKKVKVKFQWHLKDDIKIELLSKRKGLKISFCGKITTMSCQIDTIT